MISIIKVRGKFTISTFPEELIWSPLPNTILECANCMHYGCYKGILIGPCVNCASEYNGKYGSGLNLNNSFNYDVEEGDDHVYDDDHRTVAFGFLNVERTKRQLNFTIDINNYPSKQAHIKSKDAYSVYNLAVLTTPVELALLPAQNLQNYGYQVQMHGELLETVKDLHIAHMYMTDERTFYQECLLLEKRFKNKACAYCGLSGLFKCGNCKQARYCSFICQRRDWDWVHRNNCHLSF